LSNNPLHARLRRELIPQLRTYLKARLPEHMIPSVWVTLDQLPLTQNDKVDRRALPDPQSRPEGAGDSVAPSTEIECALADIWTQVLRVDEVSVKDDFFDLGGHSLHAMSLIGKVSERLGIDLSVVQVLQAPTIEQLAKLIASLQTTDVTAGDAAEYEEGVV
jgi:acyl carrier protein